MLATGAAAESSASTVRKKYSVFKYSEAEPHAKYAIYKQTLTLCVLQYLAISSSHGLSQQGVWVPFWTPKPLKRTPQDTQFFKCGISKNLNLKLIIEFFHLLIIPMILFNEIMPYFDEFIHVYD